MRKRTILIPLLMVLLLVLAACGDDGTTPSAGGTTPTTTTSPTSTGSPIETTPMVTITTPAAGSSVPAGNVTVTATVANFSVVNKLDQAAAPGEGHVHFYLDIQQPPTTPGQPAVTQSGTYHASATTSYTWPNVAAGSHTFAVQLVNNDHTPLTTPVLTSVTVTVT